LFQEFTLRFVCYFLIGEYGFLLKDPANKDDKNKPRIDFAASQDELEMVDEDELYQQEKVYVESLSPPIQPLSHEKKYLHVPFGSEKPCCHIKFPFEDQRRRHYNKILLLKIWTILVCLWCRISWLFFFWRDMLFLKTINSFLLRVYATENEK